MPLLKKKQFQLAELPADLKPDEQVWQVRFTKEIFRSYEEYLKSMRLYCQRVWTCKATGKTQLTYEEALVSENQANEKTLEFPKEFIPHVLRFVQFSTLNLDDLIAMIHEKLIDCFIEGEELRGTKEKAERPCRVLKVISSSKSLLYKVGWLDEEGKVDSMSIENSQNLVRKKTPFSKRLLRVFIKKSTIQNLPWVLSNKLAKQHGIPVEPPEHLKEKIAKNAKRSNGCSGVELELEKKNVRKVKSLQNGSDELHAAKKQKTDKKIKEVVKYPIEDLLVKPSPGDMFCERPRPRTDFVAPMTSVGDLLMVWDFCSSFGRLIHLSPFSLEDFENATVYEGDSKLIVEIHSALLTLLIKDQGEYYDLIEQKKRKDVISSKNWTDYLFDFLELEEEANVIGDLVNIKHCQYFTLGVHVKLNILGRLVHWALLTDAVRDKLDQCIEQQQALLAAKREESMEEARKRKEEKQLKAANGGGLQENSIPNDSIPNGHMQNKEIQKHVNDEAVCSDKRAPVKHKLNAMSPLKGGKDTSRTAEPKRLVEERERETSRTAELKRLREEKKTREQEEKEKKRKAQKEEHFHREMEKIFIRTNALGKDRDHNRYWFFQREGRLFVESTNHEEWGFYASKDELDGLIGSLNPKGERELALKMQLEKHYLKISTAMQKRAKEVAQKVVLDTSVLRRSVRVSVPPKDGNVPPFLKYVNKWKVS
ncbi:hypothetical protein H6P81_014198 [Aristolochia fimbriata]|uniref:DDT domain-containing protein n=1 Tax=Aristolochia fimbriata TaxID=158543 RepID=A0AAV7EGV3_ARIFI|nr:hypothetical protein H6P81_014198 [Aristolochia fimbriata]